MKKLVLIVLGVLSLNYQVNAGEKHGPSATGHVSEKTPVISDKVKIDIVEHLLTISGAKVGLQRLSDQVIAGALQNSGIQGTTVESQYEIAKSISEAYPKNIFLTRTREALIENYDHQRYAAQITKFSSLLVLRMTTLEARQPAPQDIQRYIVHIASEPLPAKRIELLRKLDSLTNTSAFNIKILLNTAETFALASAGECPENQIKIQEYFAKARPEIEKSVRSSVQVMQAYTYKDASDEDLLEYIKVYDNPDAKWILGIMHSALEIQFKSGTERMAKDVKKLAILESQNKSMFSPKCPSMKVANPDSKTASSEQDESPSKVTQAKATQSKSSQDARECLLLENAAKIAACAESFR